MKKLIALCLSLALVMACFTMPAVAEDRYLGVMLSTNVMSLDTNLATDGESSTWYTAYLIRASALQRREVKADGQQESDGRCFCSPGRLCTCCRRL